MATTVKTIDKEDVIECVMEIVEGVMEPRMGDIAGDLYFDIEDELREILERRFGLATVDGEYRVWDIVQTKEGL